MKIYLFRHGQSTYNRDEEFTGWIDARLTAEGKRDAREVGRKLRRRRIDVAFTSDLTRSKETLREVLSFQDRDVEIHEDARIKERDYGELSGHTHHSYLEKVGEELYETLVKNKHLPKLERASERRKIEEELGRAKYDVYHRSYEVPPPGGESVKDVEQRVRSFIRDLLELMRERHVNVAISAHGNSMRPFRRFFEGMSVDEMMALENPWDDFFEYDVTHDQPKAPRNG